MNEYQLKIRQNLIETGMLPNDLDVIIVNSGYETGWNLRDNRVQCVLIDSTDIDTQIQARNRIRHDIELLSHTVNMDDEGRIYEYGQYRILERTDTGLTDSYLKIELEDRYLGRKLSKEDKDYLVNKYAIIQINKTKANWKTFKNDLSANNYTLDVTNHGVYIYTNEEYENIKYKRNIKVNEETKEIDIKNKTKGIIKEYLNLKLFEDKQVEIQKKLIDIKVKTNGNGTLGKKKIQSIVEKCGGDYIFISYQETKGEMRKKRYWYITKDEEV